MKAYTIFVCPICREQCDPDRDGDMSCHHERYGFVDPIEVPAEPWGLQGLADLAEFRLTEQRRDMDWRAAEREVFKRLPKEEQERIRREQMESLGPMGRLMLESLERLHERDSRFLGAFAKGGRVPTYGHMVEHGTSPTPGGDE